MKGLESGAPSLLFEQLTDSHPHRKTESRPQKILSRTQLRESVRREIEWLLNCRSPFPSFFLNELEPTTIGYGVPDFFSLFFPVDDNSRLRLRSLLSRLVESYEPRLRQVNVAMESYDGLKRALRVRIDGVLLVGTISEPIRFEVVLNADMKGEAEVRES